MTMEEDEPSSAAGSTTTATGTSTTNTSSASSTTTIISPSSSSASAAVATRTYAVVAPIQSTTPDFVVSSTSDDDDELMLSGSGEGRPHRHHHRNANSTASTSGAPGGGQGGQGGEVRLAFSQVKGSLEDDVADADIISCVEFSPDGELLATGDKGGRVVVFQRDSALDKGGKRSVEYSFYSTFQSHEAEFDYLKSLEIEEKINKIRWLKQKNAANFLLSTNDKTIKLWKIAERDKRFDGFNLKDDAGGQLRLVPANSVTSLRVPRTVPTKVVVEPTPRRIFANAHTYLINSISVNSDQETYLSADDLRINLWNIEINDESFNIVDIKPANMEELTEVITAAEFHPHHCNYLVYSSSKGILRLCDMRAAALCDRHAKIFEEPEDNSFFSEIISSISGIKFSNNGRYLISRDYMSIKVWDINMESRPVETYQVHEYLRSKLCSLFESDYIFDKFECSINGSDTHLMTGSYNNFFKIFDRRTKRDVMYEATKEIASSLSGLKPRKVFSNSVTTAKKKKDEMNVDSLDFTSKILHTAWHPEDNIIAVAATNNLFLFKECGDSSLLPQQGVLQQPVPMESEELQQL